MNMGKKLAATLFSIALSVVSGAAYAHSFTQDELAYMPATKQIKLFKAGTITPLEVLEAQITRIEKYNGPIKKDPSALLDDHMTWNGKVNAITFERFEEARRQAREAEIRYRNKTARPLEGITVGVKDDVHFAGWRVDMGSILKKDAPVCDEDEPMIEFLRAAGAIFPFQTTVPEFYIGYMTWTKLYGISRNPWNGYYGTGGSSGGSSAALAAGFCTLATGSDMGGSIRIPASMNGIYGFKAPFGRVATTSTQYETYGPLARTFDDLVLMQNIVCGPSPKTIASIRPKLEYPTKYDSLKGACVAVFEMNEWAETGLDRDVAAAMKDVTAALRKAGAKVDVLQLPGWNAKGFTTKYLAGLMSTPMYMLINATEGGDHSQLCTYTKDMFGKVISMDLGPKRLMDIEAMQNNGHAELQNLVFTKGYDALIMPTLVTAHVPADLDATPGKKPDINGVPYPDSANVPVTPIFNLLNTYPVVNVPVRLSSKNVPIGVQVVGNTYDDIAAFRVAAGLSKVLPQLFTGSAYPDFRNAK